MWKLFGTKGAPEGKPEKPVVELKEAGWTTDVRLRLQELIAEGSGQELPVVLDMDNTILCRDIGEATFAVLEQEGILNYESVAKDLTPDFRLDGQLISLKPPMSLLQYYHYLTRATSHHALDTATHMIGYNWAVLVMQGLSPLSIVKATSRAYANGIGGEELMGGNAQTGVPFWRPFFYPQMVELIGVLLEHHYDVWIISSSNSWSVRWMMLKAINDLLIERGFQHFLMPTRVMGINTLLSGPDAVLHKDGFLVWEELAYANLDAAALDKYHLTALIVPPVTASYGKLAEILQWIGKPPYLVGGDSFGDIPMLKHAQNRLWIARMEHPEIQEYIAPLAIRKQEEKTWMIQPTLYKQFPGFIPHAAELNARKSEDEKAILRSLEVFDSYHLLKAFWG